MHGIFSAFFAELLKLRRSKLVVVTVLVFSTLPLMIGLISTGVLANPAEGESIKDWDAYLGLIVQSFAGIGVLGMGFVAAWLFGREYSDHTIKDLLALPIPRHTIVVAKLIVMTLWGCILSLITLLVTVLAGYLLGLENGTYDVATNHLGNFVTIVGLVLILSIPITTIASITRGYLAPIGLAVAAMVFAQFAGGLGIGEYFPWQIPAEFLAASGEDAQLGSISFLIMYSLGIMGTLTTIVWWRYADQK
jgi:ABC-2 type transport system permease protein